MHFPQPQHIGLTRAATWGILTRTEILTNRLRSIVGGCQRHRCNKLSKVGRYSASRTYRATRGRGRKPTACSAINGALACVVGGVEARVWPWARTFGSDRCPAHARSRSFSRVCRSCVRRQGGHRRATLLSVHHLPPVRRGRCISPTPQRFQGSQHRFGFARGTGNRRTGVLRVSRWSQQEPRDAQSCRRQTG